VTITFDGQLEVDVDRGVIYFHDGQTGATVLRICGLKIPPTFATVDLTQRNRIMYEAYVKKEVGVCG
jgi:hypothetical protein